MDTTVNNSLSASLSQAISAGDIQTAMQIVQSDRVKLLDLQLVDQVKQVAARNDQIAKLNDALSKLNAFSTNIDGTGAGDKPKDWNDSKVTQYEIPANDAIIAAGITDLGFPQSISQRSLKPGESKDASVAKLISGTSAVNSGTTKGQVDAAITKIKGLIDAESNNQQMDMLRLQSMNNKKNESVEILTTTQKKHSDSTSGIIRNM